MGNYLTCFKNNIDKIINRNDEIILNDSIILKESKTFKIYNMKKLNRTQLMKIKKLYEYINQYGKPFPSDDFDPKNWTNFYPEDDPFFSIKETEKIHNHLKIYNHKNLNKIQIYQGDLNKNGERHGIGKFTVPFYVLIGMWKKDKFSGWGRISRYNGQVLEGKFINGIINGKGILIDKNKNKYIGDFINMKKWGEGKWKTNNIEYEGEFHDNKIHGKGYIKFLKFGIEYIGTFKNEQIDGYGIFKWKNGDEYEGEVKNGKIHGLGKYKYKNGKIFNGIFFNGKIADKKTAFKMLIEKKDNKNIYTLNKNNSYNNIKGINFNINSEENNIKKDLRAFINKSLRKTNKTSFKTYEFDNRDNNPYYINNYKINNIYENNQYEPIQEGPGYIDNFHYDYDDESDILYDFNFNKDIFQNDYNNFDLDNFLNTKEYETNNNREYLENNNDLQTFDNNNYKFKFEGINDNKDYINTNTNNNTYNNEEKELIDFVNNYYSEKENNKNNDDSYQIEDLLLINSIEGTQINENIKEKENKKEPEKPIDPNLLLSTYRNFGFGDQN